VSSSLARRHDVSGKPAEGPDPGIIRGSMQGPVGCLSCAARPGEHVMVVRAPRLWRSRPLLFCGRYYTVQQYVPCNYKLQGR
jgi:hypothetical protein